MFVPQYYDEKESNNSPQLNRCCLTMNKSELRTWLVTRSVAHPVKNVDPKASRVREQSRIWMTNMRNRKQAKREEERECVTGLCLKRTTTYSVDDTGLLHLPNELLEHIFSFLPQHDWHCVAVAHPTFQPVIHGLALRLARSFGSLTCEYDH